MQVGRLRFALASSMLLALPLAGCGEGQKPAASAPPAPKVTVAKPTQKLVSDHDEYVGRFVAFDFVEVRARVSGYLDKIHFSDGQLVKQGDDLFTIDRRPFEAALDQTKAALEQAKAKRVAEASVMAQEAALRQSELDLQFTELKSPVSGRIGDRRVSIGNLVAGGTAGSTTLLATVVTVDPIRFEFTMDEASYLRYLGIASQQAASSANRGMSLPVRLKLIDEDTFKHEGKIDFVDNAIDRSSGTIRGRAEFKNADGKLTPGMFGRIQLTTSAPAMALLVPDSAIATEQVRKFVYVVSPDGVANPKYVTLGPLVDGLRVVASGLEATDTVVVNGLLRVRPGIKVDAEQAKAPGDSKESVVGTN
jgi:membrane fusion protein, multidrug efflux system